MGKRKKERTFKDDLQDWHLRVLTFSVLKQPALSISVKNEIKGLRKCS